MGGVPIRSKLKFGKILFQIIAPCILIIILSFVVKFGDDKWRDYKYKPLVKNYLSEKYSEEMVVSNIYRQKWGEYDCYTYLKKNPKISFYVFLIKDRNKNHYVIRDNYIQLLWQDEVQNEVELYLKKSFNNVLSVDFTLLNDIKKDQYLFEYKDYIPKSRIPTYNEVKNSPYIKKSYKSLEIQLIGPLKTSDLEKTIGDIYKVVMFVKEKKYNLDSLAFIFGEKDKNSGDYSYSSDNEVLLEKEEINLIKTKEDIRKYLK